MEAPGETASQGSTWQEQYDLGIRYLSEGNYEEAILAFTAAIEIDPKQAPAYVGRGNAYALPEETEDKLSAAKSDYEMAIELDKTSAEAYLGLADVYVRRGDYEKALEVLREGLEKTENAELREQLDAVQQLENAEDGLVRFDEDFTVLREISGSGLQLTVKFNGGRAVSITLSGSLLQDSYVVNRSDSDKSSLEYGWVVDMYGNQIPLGVGTTSWCWTPGTNETKALTDMQHNIWGPGENPDAGPHKYVESDIRMSYTSSSITWIFTIPEGYDFDIARVSHYLVRISDVSGQSVANGHLNADFYL